jgi:hypothetical protein
MATRTRGNRNVGLITQARIDPPPNQIYQDMLQLEKRISDYSKPLRWAKQELIVDTTLTFAKERDPISGMRWQKWSDEYGRLVIARGQTKKLRRTWGPKPGALFRAATSPRNWKIHPKGVMFAVNRLPSYWIFHQQPAEEGRLPRTINTKGRAFTTRQAHFAAKWRREHGKDYLLKLYESNPRGSSTAFAADVRAHSMEIGEAEALREYGKRTGQRIKYDKNQKPYVDGQSGKMPQRRFLGISADANARIQSRFDDWAMGILVWVERGNRISTRRIG